MPGPITSSVSAGTNLLLKTHQAKIVTEANDILGRKIAKPTLFSSLELSPIEKKIYQALEAEPLTPDELTKLTDQNIIEINKTLSLISLKGLIYEVAGKYYLQT